MRRIGGWALAGLLLTACGDDGKKSTADACEDMTGTDRTTCEREEARKDAVAKCNNLINTFCDRVTSCAEDDDLLDDASYSAAELKMDCSETIGDALRCDTAVDVGDGYDDCLADAKTFSCEESNDALLSDNPSVAGPPDSCKQQILFPPP